MNATKSDRLADTLAAALTSPDLSQSDRFRVARALADKYKQYKAALGPGQSGSALAGPPPAPSLSDVAGGAQSYDARPVTLPELFSAQE